MTTNTYERRDQSPGRDLSFDRQRNLASRILLIAVILELTAATAYIHSTLGGMLFTLNAIGYVVLGVVYALSAYAPIPVVQRFSWLPRLGLAGYALLTILAYLAMGPYFTLGWVAKGIELAIIGLVLADLLGADRSPDVGQELTDA